MRLKLQALAGNQGGIFTRQQALAVGYSEGEIKRFIRPRGRWVVVRPGAYCERDLWEEAAETETRRLLLQDRAAHVQMTLPHLMSHDSAARLHGLPQLFVPDELVHVTRFGVGGSRTHRGVKHHLTRLGLLGAVELEGIKTTGLARTGLDTAREHGFEHGLVALDAVMRRGVPLRELQDELSLMWCWPHVTACRAALELADAGGETPGETLMRALIHELDLGRVITQFPVFSEGHEAWVDAVVGPHGFEFDGFVKFTRGASDREPSEVAWGEKQRQDRINRAGFGVSRVVWADLQPRQRARTGARLAAEWRASVERHGEAIPASHLRFFESEEGRRLRAERLRD